MKWSLTLAYWHSGKKEEGDICGQECLICFPQSPGGLLGFHVLDPDGE